MSEERLDRAFAELRTATDGLRAPRTLASGLERALESERVARELVALGRPLLVACALVAAASIVLAVRSVDVLRRESAAYALAGGP